MTTKSAKPRTASTSAPKRLPAEYAAAGETAFGKLERRLATLPKDALQNVIVDVQVAALTALAVARNIEADPTLRGRFEALARAKEFDLTKLDGLSNVALAAW